MSKWTCFWALVTAFIVAWVLVSPLVDIEDGKLQPFPTLVGMLLFFIVFILSFRSFAIRRLGLTYHFRRYKLPCEVITPLELSSQLIC
jgi:hypothetical protein